MNEFDEDFLTAYELLYAIQSFLGNDCDVTLRLVKNNYFDYEMAIIVRWPDNHFAKKVYTEENFKRGDYHLDAFIAECQEYRKGSGS